MAGLVPKKYLAVYGIAADFLSDWRLVASHLTIERKKYEDQDQEASVRGT